MGDTLPVESKEITTKAVDDGAFEVHLRLRKKGLLAIAGLVLPLMGGSVGAWWKANNVETLAEEAGDVAHEAKQEAAAATGLTQDQQKEMYFGWRALVRDQSEREEAVQALAKAQAERDRRMSALESLVIQVLNESPVVRKYARSRTPLTTAKPKPVTPLPPTPGLTQEKSLISPSNDAAQKQPNPNPSD